MQSQIYLVGVGMGSAGTITEQAIEKIKACEALIGANRLVETALSYTGEKKTQIYISYQAKEIGKYIRENNYSTIVVALSGDVGFYSGAKKLLQELEGVQVELLPGISSMIYFCSKVQIPWEQICFGSAHGKRLNMIQRISRNRYCFFLLDGKESLEMLCSKLLYYNMSQVKLYIGERLSYPDERIISGMPEQIRTVAVDKLLVILVENPQAVNWVARTISDSAFVRGKVPMTKGEVRNVSIGKLQLLEDSVVYDIGAGSGSVAVEMALQSPDIKVYAVEYKEEALEIIKQNKRKFKADNVEIISGMAPKALENLPIPTHAFIGGSSGKIEQILAALFQKNPACRVVMNIIALNSLSKILQFLEKNPEYQSEIVQLQCSVSKNVGAYQLMMGQNPIYIITIWKNSEERELERKNEKNT